MLYLPCRVVGGGVKPKRRTRGGGSVGVRQVQRSIVYLDHHHPHDTRSITVVVPKTEVIDEQRAAGIVALRTGTAYDDVRVLSVRPPGPQAP